MKRRRRALRPRERAALRAFSEALLPGNGTLIGAEGESGVAVVEPVETLISHAPARVRLAARVALNLIDILSFPRRFSRLALERRAAYLERAAAASGLRGELFLLLKTLSTLAWARDPRVSQAIGAHATCRVAEGGREPAPASRPRLDASALAPANEHERCDVVVVGSGAGGASAARVVAEAGLSVILLEEGTFRDASTYPRDPFDALAALYREGGLTVCEGRPAIPLPVARCVGGTTVVNSGTCFRTPEVVLAGWRDELGIPWAAELEREFEAVERDLLVQPVDPALAGRNAELCRSGAEAIGASNGPIPRNAPGVSCCGTCPIGCALDAKQAMHVSELPRAAAAGAALRAGARAESVLVEGGRATGVRCSTGNGTARYEVRARAVVLAGGALGTPELLLTQGLANSSGEVGRNLLIHPACWVGAMFDDEVRGWEGIMQSWYVDEWSERGLFLEATFTPFALGAHWLPGTGQELKRRLESYGRLAVIGVHMSDRGSRGRLSVGRGGVRIGYRLSADDAAAIRYGIARAADIHFAAGALEVFPQLSGVESIAPGEQAERIERARSKAGDLRLEAFHPMGTARMGADRLHTVVSPTGETHDVPGLYVADASIFPTSLRVNPMITVMACARRIGAGLAERLS